MSTSEEKHKQNLLRIQQFRLFDDDFMTKCFEESSECIELVLRILMKKDDLKVMKSQTQYVIKNLQGRSVRLDVKATDAENKEYDIEIQRADKGAGKKRARHNSAMMDAGALKSGEEVDGLPESYVIFITENDIFERNEPLYPVERCIMVGDKPILFEDGAHILYVNGAYRSSEAIGKLMHDFSCTDPDEMYYSVLADRVRYFKENEKGVAAMCKIMEEYGNEVRSEALLEEKVDTAMRMIRDGELSLEKIAMYTGLPLEKVKELAAPVMA